MSRRRFAARPTGSSAPGRAEPWLKPARRKRHQTPAQRQSQLERMRQLVARVPRPTLHLIRVQRCAASHVWPAVYSRRGSVGFEGGKRMQRVSPKVGNALRSGRLARRQPDMLSMAAVFRTPFSTVIACGTQCRPMVHSENARQLLPTGCLPRRNTHASMGIILISQRCAVV